jgi:5-(carboxyamino)imidazole ribonucleotide synthase
MKIGVLGGGQLWRMLGIAGLPLGFECRFFDPSPDATARFVGELHTGRFDDLAALERFADGLDLVTLEFENVPAETARFLADRAPLYPPPFALAVAQDRAEEKAFFGRIGIPTPKYALVSDIESLHAAVRQVSVPAVLKSRRLGYDGKGQAIVGSAEEAPDAWASIGSVAGVLEEKIDFDREMSVVAVRSRSGEHRVYPLVENWHQGGILRRSVAPAPNLPAGVADAALDYAERALEAFDYVGVLAIEFFLRGSDLLANEMAPRVHNSGHWTIEGAETSQFENHLRAICGLPLGDVAPRGASIMLNLIGALPPLKPILETTGAHLHLYQKAPRPGRKIGHVTVRGDRAADVSAAARRIAALLP